MVTKTLNQPIKARQLKSDINPDWCPGCGDFGIVNAIQQAFAGLQLPPWDIYFLSGVGCSGKSSHYVKAYGAHTLHGRVLPYALGAKMANPELTVLAAGGDGDGLGIGAGHFVHAGRRNVDMTYIIFDNEVYGLTKGQASPTLAQGEQPKSLPLPNINQAINPFGLALASGYTFIARTYSYDAKHMKETITKAIQHRGMALVDVIQPCPTYNNLRTKEFFAEDVCGNADVTLPRVYYLEENGYDGVVKDPSDKAEIHTKRMNAYEKAYSEQGYDKDQRVGLGVYYQVDLPTYEDLLKQNFPILEGTTPIGLSYHDDKMKPTTDLTSGWESLIV